MMGTTPGSGEAAGGVMRHTYFEVQNFKGIERARLDLAGRPDSRIFTLVGLNESGKTTVLEALNFLDYKPESLDPLNLDGYAIADAHDLIPISKRSNFNAYISIEAGFQLDSHDEKQISEYLRKTFQFTLTSPIRAFSITQRSKFVNSKFVPENPRFTWTIDLIGKRNAERRPRRLPVGDIWQAAIRYISKLLPSVLYFPNFLFEFPGRIYLEDAPDQPEKHEYYRAVLQDVLDAVGEGTTLETHVLARAKSAEKADRQALESVLLKMSANLTENIFTQWNRIFRRTTGKKEIVVDCEQDEANRWFIQLRIRDSHELYAVTERSLGFRWFFAFLLLTVYRGFRTRETRNVLFLLDEPASNLHPSAQAQLLQSFDRLPQNCALVYTTHSHHMINPAWLESAYVVVNEGMHYEHDDDYTASKTRITMERYRTFAANHPNRTTYFQPVLDVLQYQPAKLESIPDVVMMEGKHDFFTLQYLQTLLPEIPKLNLLPGNGAGSLTDVIRLYLAWGRRFVVLLDSDATGNAEVARYKRYFGDLVISRVFTLADIDASWQSVSLEFLLSEDERQRIQNSVYPSDTSFSKTHFNRAVQELFLTQRKHKLSSEGSEAFEKVFTFCARKLQS